MNGNALIKNASQLVTCSGFTAKQGKEMSNLHIIDNGALVIEEGLITAVETTKNILNIKRRLFIISNRNCKIGDALIFVLFKYTVAPKPVYASDSGKQSELSEYLSFLYI